MGDYLPLAKVGGGCGGAPWQTRRNKKFFEKFLKIPPLKLVNNIYYTYICINKIYRYDK